MSGKFFHGDIDSVGGVGGRVSNGDIDCVGEAVALAGCSTAREMSSSIRMLNTFLDDEPSLVKPPKT